MKKANSDQPIANMKARVNDLKGTKKKSTLSWTNFFRRRKSFTSKYGLKNSLTY